MNKFWIDPLLFKEPVDVLTTAGQPNTCPFDASATNELEQSDEFTIEECPTCGKLFNFYDE